jgi:hypothetical protein
MFLILSGEGDSDIGIEDKAIDPMTNLIDNEAIGPMTKLIDNWIARRIGYSLVKGGQYAIFSKAQVVEKAKSEIQSFSRIGKKKGKETRTFYKNARGLAILAREKAQEIGADTPLILVLFRDLDGTVSADRNLWDKKWQSMLDGFMEEGIFTGVPMIPNPKSEAWILCALKNRYQHCKKLEDESGNDASPNSLKSQIEAYLGEPATRLLLNDKIDAGEIDIDRIDMDSINNFKKRLNEVLDSLLPVYEKRSIIDRIPND